MFYCMFSYVAENIMYTELRTEKGTVYVNDRMELFLYFGKSSPLPIRRGQRKVMKEIYSFSFYLPVSRENDFVVKQRVLG